jgi:GH43 family beta-xylosidase
MKDLKAQQQEAELLFAEMRRALILLDSIKGEETNPWNGSWHDVAELKSKFREIRRDSIRFERQHLTYF